MGEVPTPVREHIATLEAVLHCHNTPHALRTIEVASVINLSESSGQVAAGLFTHPPTINTLVTGMLRPDKYNLHSCRTELCDAITRVQ